MRNIMFILLLITNSVVSIEAQTTLKRFKKRTESTTDSKNIVDINVFASPVPKPKEEPVIKTAFELTDRGQEALLNGKTIVEAKDLLNTKFQEKPQQQSKVIDLTKRQIRLVFSVSRDPSYAKKTFSAYDRVEDLRYTVKLDRNAGVDKDVKLKSWNRFNTEYGSLDIGTLEYNQSFTANLDFTGTLAASATGSTTAKKDEENSSTSGYSYGPSVSATGKVGYANSRKENQSIKQRFIQLTGSLNENEFKIHQQGTRETELAGNSSIDLEIELPKAEETFATFKNLYKKDGAPDLPANVSFSANRYYIPDQNKLTDIKADLDFNYVIRHIKRKENTFAEFDDKVSFIEGKKCKSIKLVDKKSLLQEKYYIVFQGNCNLTYDSSKGAVYFLTFEEALEFRNWLLKQIPSLASDLIINSEKFIFYDGTNMYSIYNNIVKNNLVQIKIDVAN